MEKERQYQFDRTEVCRNCGGTGRKAAKAEGNWLLRRMQQKQAAEATCDVCNGTGRVEKHTEINITVKSFRECGMMNDE